MLCIKQTFQAKDWQAVAMSPVYREHQGNLGQRELNGTEGFE